MNLKICPSRVHCVACRTNPRFRAMLVKDGQVATAEFDCPFGITAATARAEKAAAQAKRPAPPPKAPRPTKEEQGRAAWQALHAAAKAGTVTERWLITEFRRMVPSFGCSCLREWESVLAAHPLRPADQFNWSVDVHNAVNASLAAKGDATKRQWSYAEALAAVAAPA